MSLDHSPQGVPTIDEETIDLRRYVGVFLSHWWLLILLPTVGGLLGYFYSHNQEPVYEAKATILVQYRGGGFIPGFSDFRRSEELAATYRRLVTAKPFLDGVQRSPSGLPEGLPLASMVSASTVSNPPVLEVKVRHGDPDVAAAAAQVVAREFIDYAIQQRLAEFARLRVAAASQGITNVEDLVAAQLAAVDSLSLLESVAPPQTPVVPRTRLNITLGVVLGLLLASAGALVLDNLRDTVRFPDQLGRRFGVSNLGTIFKWSAQDADPDEMVLLRAPTSSYAEAFRQIRANLQFATANRPGQILMVASPGPEEGKTTIACNLAVALAHTGKRVVTIDGDLRRPSVHRFYRSVEKTPGLSNFLADLNVGLEDVIHATEVEGVHVIPGGPSPPNPAELLGSPKMAGLLSRVREEYDLVLVDSPPVLLVADGSIMASQVDAVIAVVDGFTTRSSSLRAALDTLRRANADVVGAIINKLKTSRFAYGYIYPYHYYYYSNYSYYADGDRSAVNGNGRIAGRIAQAARSVLSRLRRA